MDGKIKWLYLATISLNCFWPLSTSSAEESTSNPREVPVVTDDEVFPIPPNPMAKIVNGTRAARGSYPFMVALFIKIGRQLIFNCGAAVFDLHHVITAAHCVPEEVNHWDIYLLFGRWNLGMLHEIGEQVRGVTQVLSHPHYNTTTKQNDIAILRLNSALNFDDTVLPICLTETPVIAGENAIIMGWGDTRKTGDPSYLQVAFVPIVSLDECTQDGWIDPEFVKEGMICAGYASGQIGSCQGDSGGPLVRRVGESFELIGIVSWGYPCAQPRKPDVYTNIHHHIPWIKETVGDLQFGSWMGLGNLKCLHRKSEGKETSTSFRCSALIVFLPLMFQIIN